MTIKEANRLHMIKMAVEKRSTLKQAAEKLGISLRQAIRIKKRYALEGAFGILSKRKGKIPANKHSEEIRKKSGPNTP